MAEITKLRLPYTSNTSNINVALERNGVTVSETFDITLPPDAVAPPTVPDVAGTVTVGQTLILSPLSAPGASGEDRTIISITAPDNGGATTDTATIINNGTQISFVANNDVESVTFDYTVRTGSGTPPDGDDVAGTITINKQAEQQAGDGTVTIISEQQTGNVEARTHAPVARLSGVAPAGFFFSAQTSGFGVPQDEVDLDFAWNFGEADGVYFDKWNDVVKTGSKKSSPQDRVFDDAGTVKIVRGRGVFAADGTTLLGESGVKRADGWGPANAGATYLGPAKNFAFLPHTAHVFDTPGTYTVTCSVRKRGEAPSTDTIQVVVADPDTYFSSSETYVLALNGDFSGAPSHDVGNRYTTWDSAVSAMNSGSSGARKRLLVRRGHTYPASAQHDDDYEFLHISSFGDSADSAPLVLVGIDASGMTMEMSVSGIDIKPGNYDPSDPYGGQKNNDAGNGISKRNSGFVTMWDCQIRSMSVGVKLSAKGASNLVMGNSLIRDWGDYGSYISHISGYAAYVGTWIMQNEDAVRIYGKRRNGEEYGADHGPNRIASLSGPFVCRQCWLDSTNNWSPGVYWQPCSRNGRSTSYRTTIEQYMYDRVYGIHGAFLAVGNSQKPKLALYHGCTNIIQNAVSLPFQNYTSGLHVHNSLLVLMNNQNTGGVITSWCERPDTATNPYSDFSSVSTYGFRVSNCTLVDQRSGNTMGYDLNEMRDGFTFSGETYLPFKYVQIGNNVVYCPNKSDPSETGDEPIDDVNTWHTSAYPGVRIDTFSNLNTNFSVDSDTHAYFDLEAGSPAIGDAAFGDRAPLIPVASDTADTPVAIRDYHGLLRASTTSRGHSIGPSEAVSF